MGTTRLVGGALVRLGRERLDRHPSLPRHAAELDARTLGALLGRRVEAVEVLDGTTGTTDRARLALIGHDVPSSVFVKVAASSAAIRLFGDLADLGHDEVRFYRHVRPALPVEAPTLLGSAFDGRTKRFVLVLEDLAARGCAFPDVLAPVDADQAAAVLDQLGALHGSQWEHARLREQGWIRSGSTDRLLPLVARALPRAAKRLAARDPGFVPPAGRAILDRYREVTATLDRGAQTLLHGDPHPGNVYLDGDRAGLLDWQVVRRGSAWRDVAYFLVLGLEPEVRRAHERDLLAHHGAALAAHGGPTVGPDETWAAYRRMAAYPYVSATFTAAFAGLQDQALAEEGARRAALAIDDLGTDTALAR